MSVIEMLQQLNLRTFVFAAERRLEFLTAQDSIRRPAHSNKHRRE